MMTRLTLGQISPHFAQLWVLVRQGLIVACAIAGGMMLAYLLLSPHIALTVSIVGVFIHFIIIWFNPVSGLLFWLIFYPFSESSINISLGAGIPDLSPTRFTILFASVIFFAQLVVRKRTWPRMTRLDWAIIGFMVAIILSTFGSNNFVGEIQFVFDIYVIPLIIYFLVKNLVTDRRELNKVLAAVMIIATYSAIYIIFEQTTSYVIDFGKPPDSLITFTYNYAAYTESLRLVQGLYEGTHVFGLVFTMAIPFAFYLLFKSSSRTKKMLWAFLIGLMFIGLFYTYKRAAYFSVPISFLVIQFFYPQFRRVFFVILIVFGLILAVTWNQVNQSAVMTERMDDGDLSTGNGRDEIFSRAINLWKQRPLFGHGFGTIDNKLGTTENFYLAVLVASGIVGFIPYLLMLIFVATNSIMLYRQAGSNPHLFVDRDLIAVFWGSMLTYILKSFSGEQGVVMSNVMFMLIIGAVVGSQEAALAFSRSPKKGLVNNGQ